MTYNDASSEVSVKHLQDMGVNLFNMAFDTDLNHLKEVTNNKVTTLGNMPPRDVLAAFTEEDVENSLLHLIKNMKDKKHIILSCGGGMTPMVKSQNLKRFVSFTSKTLVS